LSAAHPRSWEFPSLIIEEALSDGGYGHLPAEGDCEFNGG